VRVRAGARVDQIGGGWDGPDGRALLVAVRAPALEDRANAAVGEAIASAFHLRRTQVRLVAGRRSRTKTFELTGEEAVLTARLAELLGSAPQQ